MRALLVMALLATLPLSTNARAEEPARPWSLWLGPTFAVLGDKRPTGGFGVAARVRREIPTTLPWLRADAGLDASGFGFFGGSRWVGFWGGPSAGVTVVPSRSVSFGLGIGVDGGRVPTCNNWGLCLRHWGLFPRATLSGSYAIGPRLAVSAACSVRYVPTLGWSGASVETTLAGVFRL